MSLIISQNGKNARKIDQSGFASEDELQQYIYENPESIPLSDIKEDIRLLIIAREFPTQSGPIDAVGIDRDGALYLIETKLYRNADKRHVVAQVLDYGASLWRHSTDFASFLGELERQSQKKWGMGLSQKLQEFFDVAEEDVQTMTDNLRRTLDEGIFQFVVLMDTLHDPLKDLILFLNQYSKFTLYVAEIEYYKFESYEIMIPRLFGAEVKKDLSVGRSASPRGHWNEESFFADAESKLLPRHVQALRELYHFTREIADTAQWGSGVTNGSYLAKFSSISPKSVYSFSSDGRLYINFGWLNGSPSAEEVRDRLYRELSAIPGLSLPQEYREVYPGFKVEQWEGKLEAMKKAIVAAVALGEG